MQSVQRELIGIALSVDERVLPWCLQNVGELQPYVCHPVWNRANRSKLTLNYCNYWTDGEGFVSFPPQVLVHRVRHYTPSVISIKVAVMNVAEEELSKENCTEAFPVREDVVRVAE